MTKKRQVLSIILAIAIINTSIASYIKPIAAATAVDLTGIVMKYSAADGSRPNYIFEAVMSGPVLPAGETGDNYTTTDKMLFNETKISDIYGAAVQWAPVDSGAGRANRIYIHIPKATYESNMTRSITFLEGFATPFTDRAIIRPVGCVESYKLPVQWNIISEAAGTCNIGIIAASGYQGAPLDRHLIRLGFDTPVSATGSGNPEFGGYNSGKVLINGKPYTDNSNWSGMSLINSTIIQLYVVSALYNNYSNAVRTIEVKKGFILPNGRATASDFKAILNDGASEWNIRSAVLTTSITEFGMYQRADSGPNYIFAATVGDKIQPDGTSGNNYTVPDKVLFNGVPISDPSLYGAAVQWAPDVLGADKSKKILIFIPKAAYESAKARTIAFAEGFTTPYGTQIGSVTYTEAYNERYLLPDGASDVNYVGAPSEQSDLNRFYVDLQFDSDIAAASDVGTNPLFGIYNSDLLLFNGSSYSSNSWNGISILSSTTMRIYIATAVYNSYTAQRELVLKKGFILPNGRQTTKDYTALFNEISNMWNLKNACIINSYSVSSDGTSNGTVTGVPAGSSLNAFLQNIVLGADITYSATNYDNQPITAIDVVGTGTKFNVYNSDASINMAYTVIIYGDLDGTGVIDIQDLVEMKSQLMKIKQLDSYFSLAADINDNRTIGISELLSLKKHVLGIKLINQSGRKTDFKIDGNETLPSDALVFDIADYGAKGDGVTDDSDAIRLAMEASFNADSNVYKLVRFKDNTTYRVANSSLQALFEIDGRRKIVISGNNTKILLKYPTKVATIKRSSEIKIIGFVYDYSPKPFVLGEITEINQAEASVTLSTDGDLGFDNETYTPVADVLFALLNTPDSRYHYYISYYKKISDNNYKMFINPIYADRLSQVSIGNQMILPYAGVETIGAGFDIIQNTGSLSVVNCNIESLLDFGFHIRLNKGEMFFSNLNFKPTEGSQIKLVQWRDGFHVKDNIKPIIWDNCYIGMVGDDAFNLTAVTMTVNNVSADKRTFSFYPDEGSDAQQVNANDDFIVYDLVTGEYIGEGKVSKVLSQIESGNITIQSETAFPKMKIGVTVGLYKNANPGATIRNCYIEGTARFRSNTLIENTRFNVFWIKVENEAAPEGPIPKDVTFKQCTFTTPYPSNTTIVTVLTTRADGDTNCEYKCKNILFSGCRFIKGNIYTGSGNQVVIN